ncbi:MAG: agmatine deiminase family protein [Sphingobacteriaceae bacterium]|nr:agmatine deiminase family protein [Sphingobacteriaceae bacterium]
MKYFLKLLFLFIGIMQLRAQDLPKGFAPGEELLMDNYLNQKYQQKSAALINTPPQYSNLRNAAEWEEIQTLMITWTSYTPIHRQIILAAQNETKITIVCSDSNAVKSNLNSNSVPLTNLRFVVAPFNSVWIRDYFGNSVYGKYVDSLILVDWIYNRPRPLDDVIPTVIGSNLNIPVYETTQSPNWNLIHTGGNYMSDGLGTAFSSTLTDQENPTKTVAMIDTIMKKFMGINRYIRMPTLPYDGIHHIDMHMKLLDEETLLVGEYPTGVADGPQIEANLAWILANYNSVFGTPYKVIRIPMPKDKNNKWPNQSGGWYCTFTNGVFVNKSYIFPTFYQQYDTTAFRILKASLPGYKITGIDCDEPSSPIISASGAIHCITHAVHVNDPLLITHQRLSDKCQNESSYAVSAKVFHKTGLNNVTLYWTNDTLMGFTPLNMTLVNPNTGEYAANIPQQNVGQTIYYYISANAVSGKTITRPITAPLGRWTFKVQSCITGIQKFNKDEMKPVYPNPAGSITCIPLHVNGLKKVNVTLLNALGQEVAELYSGMCEGDKNVFLHAENYSKGVYFIRFQSNESVYTQKLIIK